MSLYWPMLCHVLGLSYEPSLHSFKDGEKLVGLFIDKSLALNNCRSGGSHSSESGVDVGLKVALHVLLQTLDVGDSSSLELIL